ncbi:MAG: hypothetical protein ACLRTX_07140 [Christensenellales bacterium]
MVDMKNVRLDRCDFQGALQAASSKTAPVRANSGTPAFGGQTSNADLTGIIQEAAYTAHGKGARLDGIMQDESTGISGCCPERGLYRL